MVQPQLVVNDSFKLQGPVADDYADPVFEYYKGTSIFAAEQLLIKIAKNNPRFSGLAPEYLSYSRKLYSILSNALLDFVEMNQLSDGRIVIVSENNNYQFLENFLYKRPPLLLEHICRYVIELGQALNAFHRQGLVYGGLDGKAVLVHTIGTTINEIKVQKAGYGPFISAILEKTRENSSALVYMAPELLSHNEGVVQSDMYSLGVHLFKFLTGNFPVPFDTDPAKGPSLHYVAKALVRRNVPKELILLILNCLRVVPELRPATVVDVLTPLRIFIDERRKRVIQSEGIDPMAVLDVLNMGKQRFNAQEVVRVLDTVDYFKSLSCTSTDVPQQKALEYPVIPFNNPDQVAAVELKEAYGPRDDVHLEAEDYLEFAISSVSQEEYSRLNLPIEEDVRNTYYSRNRTTIQKAETTNAIEQIPSNKAEGPMVKIKDERIALPISTHRSKNDPFIQWKSYKVTAEEIVLSLQKAKSLARKSHGTLSLIEEPPQGAIAMWLNRAILQCKEGSLYADLGAIPANTSIQQLLMALFYALTPALMGESKRYLQLLKTRLNHLGFSHILQIDYVSPGYHGIFFKDISGMDLSIDQAIAIIKTFSRRKTPLFIVMRNIEQLGRVGNSLLMALKDSIPSLPIIFLGFFKSRQVEDWHILSNLKAQS